jgi:hypothetical protein
VNFVNPHVILHFVNSERGMDLDLDIPCETTSDVESEETPSAKVHLIPVPETNVAQPTKSNPFRLILLAHKHDAESAFAQLPRDLINCILPYCEVRAVCRWQLLDHPNAKLTILDDGRTALNDVQGYRMQPFHSMDPISYECFIFTFS